MSGGGDGSRTDGRQLLLVGVAVAALVLAAFFAPQASPQPQPEPPDIDTPEEESELPIGDGGSGGGGDGIVAVGEGDGEAREIDTGSRTVEAQCALLIRPEPTPGARVWLRLLGPSGPISGAEIRFDGESIGRTDDTGRVSGRVPYREELSISATYEGDDGCTLDRVLTGEGDTASAAVLDTDGSPAAAASDSEGPSVSVPVEGEVEIGVSGTPYPGETVRLKARIAGEPMRSATVAVDGERVGETDDQGVYRGVQIPDDGAERVSVTVTRGDFSGTRSITVALLEGSISPAGVLALPGSRVFVLAERGDERVADAAVRVDGERVGTTDDRGALLRRAPTALDATVTVATDRQAATIDVRRVYEATALGVLVYALASALVAGLVARTYGRQSGTVAGAGAVGLFALALLYSYGGQPALVVAVVVLCVAGLSVLAARNRDAVSGGADAAGGVLSWIARSAIAAARWIEDLAARIGPILSRLGARIRDASSLRAALAGLGRWLRALPARAVRALPALSRRRVALPLLALAATAAALLVAGWPGALAAAAVFAALALALGRTEAEEGGTAAEADTPPDAAAPDLDVEQSSAAEPRTLRERWRAFARRVRPARWRKSTTGDVQRAASEQEYPEQPVETLAAAFRRLEYGPEGVDDETRERADEAYETLSEHRERGDDR